MLHEEIYKNSIDSWKEDEDRSSFISRLNESQKVAILTGTLNSFLDEGFKSWVDHGGGSEYKELKKILEGMDSKGFHTSREVLNIIEKFINLVKINNKNIGPFVSYWRRGADSLVESDYTDLDDLLEHCDSLYKEVQCDFMDEVEEYLRNKK